MKLWFLDIVHSTNHPEFKCKDTSVTRHCSILFKCVSKYRAKKRRLMIKVEQLIPLCFSLGLEAIATHCPILSRQCESHYHTAITDETYLLKLTLYQ